MVEPRLSAQRRPPNGPVGRLSVLIAIVAMACTDGPTSTEDEPSYLLPFPVGDSAQVIQGNNGSFTHFGHAAYAFDFRMTIGRVVTAMRAGQVIATEERYIDGNRTPGQTNLVLIRHDDGTYARYYHLTTNGALVTLGQRVAAGDTIGLSGDTGYSTTPHLHVDVTRDCVSWGCQTIWIRFQNAGADTLVAGRVYRAE
jgi:murein DD-endopeptidase MepM/ murein hydrolase activator NlpD